MELKEHIEIVMTYTNKILGLNLSEEEVINKIEFDIECDIDDYFLMLDYYKFLIKENSL
jgi:hypothetical protein